MGMFKPLIKGNNKYRMTMSRNMEMGLKYFLRMPAQYSSESRPGLLKIAPRLRQKEPSKWVRKCILSSTRCIMDLSLGPRSFCPQALQNFFSNVLPQF